MFIAVLVVLAAYAIGNIPFAPLVARLAGHDIYAKGSKNPGASNVARIAGWRWGLLAMVLDIAKGLVPTLLVLIYADSYLSNEQTRALGVFVGLGAMAGHVVPIGRKGGKGIATGAGAILALFPIAGIVAIAIWFFIMKIVKLPVVSSIAASAILPIWVGFDHDYWWEFILVTLLFFFVVLRHIPNLRRLVRREESALTKNSRQQFNNEIG